ncbi:peptidyl-prolyl cis-trans isomerase [Candidatus Endoriftia persephonae]|jgi:tetratricopeptide (TPR) repeat protein|uniref:Tetratricopeptide repeat protein n=2 Tax=Gammaproteobacteria TaxID=1236 RepID=G2FDS8_9GAMM|nr:peptidyl-prolyl cis-trans isomerase [Candidatus Endoriftia persephone]EGW55133.1 hypothetical protein TevJSym_af00980 [endosymbiont of Tevnia jerichonana (vent Tica)]USF88261.1 peptidylprolyl isomerase [Candidatus Endoriftia persephone]
MNTPSAHQLHLSIAEAGKLLALKGNHTEALQHYREALRLAVSAKAPEVFFRHYTQCVLESLELTDAYDEIIRFCQDADAHYAKLGLHSSLHRRDHGAVLERLGLVYLKSGNPQAGREALQKACEHAGAGVLPLSEELLGWLRRGFSIDKARLLRSQQRHHYFVVRPDQVDGRRATPLSSTPQSTVPDPAKALTG